MGGTEGVARASVGLCAAGGRGKVCDVCVGAGCGPIHTFESGRREGLRHSPPPPPLQCDQQPAHPFPYYGPHHTKPRCATPKPHCTQPTPNLHPTPTPHLSERLEQRVLALRRLHLRRQLLGGHAARGLLLALPVSVSVAALALPATSLRLPCHTLGVVGACLRAPLQLERGQG